MYYYLLCIAVVWNFFSPYKSNDCKCSMCWLLSKRRWTKKASFWPFTRCDVLVAGSLHSNAMNILWRRGTVKLSDDSMDGGEGKKNFLIERRTCCFYLLLNTWFRVLLFPRVVCMYIVYILLLRVSSASTQKRGNFYGLVMATLPQLRRRESSLPMFWGELDVYLWWCRFDASVFWSMSHYG